MWSMLALVQWCGTAVWLLTVDWHPSSHLLESPVRREAAETNQKGGERAYAFECGSSCLFSPSTSSSSIGSGRWSDHAVLSQVCLPLRPTVSVFLLSLVSFSVLWVYPDTAGLIKDSSSFSPSPKSPLSLSCPPFSVSTARYSCTSVLAAHTTHYWWWWHIMDMQTDKMSAKILLSYTSFIATMIGGPTPTHSLTAVETSGSRFGWLAWFFGCWWLMLRTCVFLHWWPLKSSFFL